MVSQYDLTDLQGTKEHQSNLRSDKSLIYENLAHSDTNILMLGDG